VHSYQLVAEHELSESTNAFDLSLTKSMSAARSVEFLRGRQLLRQLVSDYWQCDLSEIKFAKQGRKWQVIAPKPLYISLAHTDGWFVATCANKPIGIDIELINRRAPMLPIAKRYFREAEYAWLLAKMQPEIAALELWTAKEAYVKCIGSTLASELGRIEFNSNLQTPGYTTNLITEKASIICIIEKI